MIVHINQTRMLVYILLDIFDVWNWKTKCLVTCLSRCQALVVPAAPMLVFSGAVWGFNAAAGDDFRFKLLWNALPLCTRDTSSFIHDHALTLQQSITPRMHESLNRLFLFCRWVCLGCLWSFFEGSCLSTADCVCFSIRCRSCYACVRVTAAASSVSMCGAGMLSSLWLCSWSSQIYRWLRRTVGLIFMWNCVCLLYFGDKAVAKYDTTST